ncbi:type 3 dihydrofolate reductase [Alteromonadaceae bacterium M269]|nr:type 3 dihydrofolate reductase [Alteromonadaceae bacterium M269]
MIAAMASNRVIGRDNQMPWHLPADLKHFKQVTLGKPIVMGRKTYESIGKALPGRLNIVLSRDPSYQLKDATVVANVDEAVSAAGDIDELMIIGGGYVYQQFLERANKLYLTFIALDVDGDTQFPDYEASGSWKVIEEIEHEQDEKNAYNYRFVTKVRE